MATRRRSDAWFGAVVALACVGVSACTSDSTANDGDQAGSSNDGGPQGTDGGSSRGDGGASALNPLTRHKAEMLTSIWENSTTVLQYGFSRNNGDGYGYTSGRAGFTTGTNDSYFVVKCFDAAYGTNHGNLMAKYEAALAALSKRSDKEGVVGDVSTLDAIGKYNADWRGTAADPKARVAFDRCQDQIVENLYITPALAIKSKWGLQTELATAILYDAMIENGEDNVTALAAKANSDTGNGAQVVPTTPKTVQAESDWFKAFLVHRVALMAGSGAWSGGIDRGANYEKLRRDANWSLTAPIVTTAKTTDLFSGGPYTDANYPVCTIAPDGTVSGDDACTAAVAD